MASDRVLTVPNIISFVRILAVPVFVWFLLGAEQIRTAGLLLIVIGATDWIDGYLARRLGQVTKLGKALDPIADRLAIVAAVVAGWMAGILPAWLVVGLLVREAVMAAMAAWLFAQRRTTVDVRMTGKLATLLLYGAIPSLYLAAASVAPRVFEPLGLVSGAIGLVLYWTALMMYGRDIAAALKMPVSSPR